MAFVNDVYRMSVLRSSKSVICLEEDIYKQDFRKGMFLSCASRAIISSTSRQLNTLLGLLPIGGNGNMTYYL